MPYLTEKIIHVVESHITLSLGTDYKKGALLTDCGHFVNQRFLIKRYQIHKTL